MTTQTAISPALELFGTAVKTARQSRGWPLAKLALEALENEDRKGYYSQVEKGRRNLSKGTILSFSRALDLPPSATDPLLGFVLPPEDDKTLADTNASIILNEAEALRARLKLSEALAVALAYKYADCDPTDIEGALKGLGAALELAAAEKQRDAVLSNLDEAVNELVDRVATLNEIGEVDCAYAELQLERERRREARERRIAEDHRKLDLVISQATYTNDPEGAAEATLEKIQMATPSARNGIERLRELFLSATVLVCVTE